MLTKTPAEEKPQKLHERAWMMARRFRLKNLPLGGAVASLRSVLLRRRLKRFLYQERLAGNFSADGLKAVESLERCDGYAHLRNAMRLIAAEREEWAGIPMPMGEHPIVIEPRYPNARALMEMRDKPEPEEPGVKLRNTFWSKRYRCYVYVYEEHGKVRMAPAGSSAVDRILSTIDVSHAWGIEQEGRAVQLLGTMLRHHQFKAYLLTGAFMEAGRSDVLYVIRRLRPTIAIRRNYRTEKCSILACLCMHPIAYYSDSWGGGMCPTDDVIAHLTMIRGDEHLYWRRCNQHQPDKPESGL